MSPCTAKFAERANLISGSCREAPADARHTHTPDSSDTSQQQMDKTQASQNAA